MEQAKTTPLLHYAWGKHKKKWHYIYQINEPYEVATQMVWLGSNQASFMNGQVLIQDGGLSITTSNYVKFLDAEEANDQYQAELAAEDAQ